MTGDGTTSTVLLIGEFLKQSELYITEGLHPRAVTEGFEKGKKKALDVLVRLAKKMMIQGYYYRSTVPGWDLVAATPIRCTKFGLHSTELDNCLRHKIRMIYIEETHRNNFCKTFFS